MHKYLFDHNYSKNCHIVKYDYIQINYFLL